MALKAPTTRRGPGQNEIDFRYSDALTAADNALDLPDRRQNGCRAATGCARTSAPSRSRARPGNGFHINMSVKADGRDPDNLPHMVAGILDKIVEMTAFLNPTENSYKRFGSHKGAGLCVVVKREPLAAHPHSRGRWANTAARSCARPTRRPTRISPSR